MYFVGFYLPLNPSATTVLLSVCSLYFTLSLHFAPGPQSAVRSLQSSFYTDRFWKRRQSVFPLFIGFVYNVIVVFCRCLCTRLWSLCWRRCLRCAKRCSLLRGCLLRFARRWNFNRRSPEEFQCKIFLGENCSRHLLCMQFCVICMGNGSWFTDDKHCFTDDE